MSKLLNEDSKIQILNNIIHSVHVKKQELTEMTELADEDVKRAIVTPYTQELRRKHEHNREMQGRNKIPFNSFLCLLELKNPTPDIKIHWIDNIRLDTAEDKTNELEDIVRETTKTETRVGEKKQEKKSSDPQWLLGQNRAV